MTSTHRRPRRQTIRRRRAVAGLVLLALAALVLAVSGGQGAPRHPPSPSEQASAHRSAQAPAHQSAPAQHAPFPVATTTVTFTDPGRTMRLPSGASAPRRLVTDVLYPGARAGARSEGPFPLVVFGHGFALSPHTYWPLLTAWARAGYVVAAPVFPLENSAAPGGPSEADLPNQPADISFVITRLVADRGLGAAIDPARIAVAGHSDGGDSALAVAEGPTRDRRVRAAVILAGAQMRGVAVAPGGAPLLAIQGTADPINPPSATATFFGAAGSPKYRVDLLGASHILPYSTERPQLQVVERVTLAFLARYLRGDATTPLRAAATVTGVADIVSDP